MKKTVQVKRKAKPEKETEISEIKDLLKELTKSTKSIEKTLEKMSTDEDKDWLPNVYI